MTERHGHDAFVALSHLLAGTDTGLEWSALSPSVERLRLAMVDSTQRASSLDLAVLLRQAMTYEYVRRGAMVLPAIPISHPRFDGFATWEAVGLRATVVDRSWLVTLQLWNPAWLS